MNIVFWFGILAAAAIVWYLSSKYFFRIGDNAISIFKNIKHEINKKEEDENNE